MAILLKRRSSFFTKLLLPELPQSRLLSTDAIVEYKPGEIGFVSGIPEEHLRRRVIIYSPARTATQQGSGKVGKWKINFVSTQKTKIDLYEWKIQKLRSFGREFKIHARKKPAEATAQELSVDI